MWTVYASCLRRSKWCCRYAFVLRGYGGSFQPLHKHSFINSFRVWLASVSRVVPFEPLSF